MAFWRATDVDLPSNSKIITVNTGDDVANVYTGYIIQINTGQFLEVKTVNTGASPQTIELFTNYTGSSITGGTAIAAPTQGAIKEAAEELRALRTTYEGIADSVATTPTANSVVKRTSTGQVKVADAVETNDAVSLGQTGSALTYDVTTSSTDTTANRLSKVGDFGLGSLDCPTIVNLETNEVGAGLYKFRADYVGAPPETSNTTLWYSCLVIQSLQDRVTFKAQLVTGTEPRLFLGERIGKTGSIGWVEVYTTGNSINAKDYGVGNSVRLSSPNLNTLTKAGFYYVFSATNSPSTGNAGHLLVEGEGNLGTVAQTFIPYNKDNYHFRRRDDSGVWSDWQELYHSGNTNFNEFYTPSGNLLVSGYGRNTSLADFNLPLNSNVSPTGITAAGTFRIIDLVTDNTVLTGATPTFVTASTSKTLVVRFSGSFTSGRNYLAVAESGGATITVNY